MAVVQSLVMLIRGDMFGAVFIDGEGQNGHGSVHGKPGKVGRFNEGKWLVFCTRWLAPPLLRGSPLIPDISADLDRHLHYFSDDLLPVGSVRITSTEVLRVGNSCTLFSPSPVQLSSPLERGFITLPITASASVLSSIVVVPTTSIAHGRVLPERPRTFQVT
ncbi:hypothetical protein Bbelb_133990 [Branchiostoma belcheri]|nr:hypothetical protein Bbelb_133990 [Branchiostoma belcheri]